MLLEDLRKIQFNSISTQNWVENLAESGVLRRTEVLKQNCNVKAGILHFTHIFSLENPSGSWGHLGRAVVTWMSCKCVLGILWTGFWSWAKTVLFRQCDSKGHHGPVPRDVPWDSFKWVVWMQLWAASGYRQGTGCQTAQTGTMQRASQERRNFVGNYWV